MLLLSSEIADEKHVIKPNYKYTDKYSYSYLVYQFGTGGHTQKAKPVLGLVCPILAVLELVKNSDISEY